MKNYKCDNINYSSDVIPTEIKAEQIKLGWYAKIKQNSKNSYWYVFSTNPNF